MAALIPEKSWQPVRNVLFTLEKQQAKSETSAATYKLMEPNRFSFYLERVGLESVPAVWNAILCH